MPLHAKAVDLCPYAMDNYWKLLSAAGLLEGEQVVTVLHEGGKVRGGHWPDRALSPSGKARRPPPVRAGDKVKDPLGLAERLYRNFRVDRVLVVDLEAARGLEAELFGRCQVPPDRFAFEAYQRERLARWPGIIQYPSPPPDRFFAGFTYRELEGFLQGHVPDRSSVTAAVFRGNEIYTGFIWEIEGRQVVRWSNYERLRGRGLRRIRGLDSIAAVVSAVKRCCLPLSRGYFLELSAAVRVLRDRDRIRAFGAALREGKARYYRR